MPLRSIERHGDHQLIGLWEITESLSEFESMAADLPDDVPKDITHDVKLREWYCTRLLTSHCVKEFGMEYRGIQKDQFGKPWLLDNECFISVTHCYPMVAVILDGRNPVGIDLERHRNQIRRISHRFMSAEELSHADEPEYLLICWTAKEALYKLHGRKSLEFRSELLIDPFTPDSEGVISGTIVNGEVEKHDMYYKFINDGSYVVLHSID